MNSSSSSSRYPFTPSQWQELEQQALIYKYMASGIPIPSDLLLPMKRSFFLPSTQPRTDLMIDHAAPAGWTSSACHQYQLAGYGVGRKAAEDPEPWRCRRTDGKKWRCSKEAYDNSKYCERHMHRGKNRSRKPVEISLNNTNNAATKPYPHSSWELRQRESDEEERGKHCFVLGADFKMEKPVKERDFFSFDVGESSNSLSTSTRPTSYSSSSSSNYSKTQLSISIPIGLHDFPHQWLVSDCGGLN